MNKKFRSEAAADFYLRERGWVKVRGTYGHPAGRGCWRAVYKTRGNWKIKIV